MQHPKPQLSHPRNRRFLICKQRTDGMLAACHMYRLRHSGKLFWLGAFGLTGLINVKPTGFKKYWAFSALCILFLLSMMWCIHRAGWLKGSLHSRGWLSVQCVIWHCTELLNSDSRYHQDRLCVKVIWDTQSFVFCWAVRKIKWL